MFAMMLGAQKDEKDLINHLFKSATFVQIFDDLGAKDDTQVINKIKDKVRVTLLFRCNQIKIKLGQLGQDKQINEEEMARNKDDIAEKEKLLKGAKEDMERFEGISKGAKLKNSITKQEKAIEAANKKLA